MAVAIAAHFVVHAVEDEHAVLERRERRHDFLELEVGAGGIGPIGGGDGAVGAEHEHQPLARARGRGEAEAGQAGDERERGGGEAGLLEESATIEGVHVFYFVVLASFAVPCNADTVTMSTSSFWTL